MKYYSVFSTHTHNKLFPQNKLFRQYNIIYWMYMPVHCGILDTYVSMFIYSTSTMGQCPLIMSLCNKLNPSCCEHHSAIQYCLACRRAPLCMITGHPTYRRKPSIFCLASMVHILFRASVKQTYLASIFCCLYVLANDKI